MHIQSKASTFKVLSAHYQGTIKALSRHYQGTI